jgi:bifunctional non-homologous end joining protein LigD
MTRSTRAHTRRRDEPHARSAERRARPLQLYREKRDFARTPEPAPASARRAGAPPLYVVQKHAAHRLHYDFRLELDGVLLSWAVPKGPSLDPKVKRLAVATEDHPLEYANFEGVIPKGEYGAGPILVWDRGTWEPIGDAREGYRRGHLEFRIQGKKLAGRWHLVRTGGTASRNWLLFKGRDAEARPGSDGLILEQEPESALSERTLAQVRSDPNRIWRSGAARLPLTHPNRVLDAESRLTKLALAEYYAAVAPFMLPHVVNRPLTLVRCPEGRSQPCFYQKHWSEGFPEWLLPVAIRESGKNADYIRIDDLAGLLSLVQIGTLEIHIWGARADDPERPDQLVFDLDPDPKLPWSAVIAAALRMRRRLDELGLKSFVKTTGGKGLHVVSPIAPCEDWDATKAFCKAVADSLVAETPRGLIATMSKAKRHGKIFIDYFRNSRGATAIAPYSTRARPGAPVATPLGWDELPSQPEPFAFGVQDLGKRLERAEADPWHDFFTVRQSVGAAARRKLEKR